MKKDAKVANIDPQKVVRQFDQLQSAAIDACSMIYLQRINLLAKLGAQLELTTPAAVLHEARLPAGFPIKVFDELPRAPADRQLIDLALKLGCPVISDDRKVLALADRHGLDYFNSLMMIFYLFHVGKLDHRQLLKKREQIRVFAYYAPWIEAFADRLFDLMNKNA
ncbi:hypothetical protein ACX8XP_03630 [Calditrichota bacterium LG25]